MPRTFTKTERRNLKALDAMRNRVRLADQGTAELFPENLEVALSQAIRAIKANAAIAELMPTDDEWQSACGIVEETATALDRYGVERPTHYDEETDIR